MTALVVVAMAALTWETTSAAGYARNHGDATAPSVISATAGPIKVAAPRTAAVSRSHVRTSAATHAPAPRATAPKPAVRPAAKPSMPVIYVSAVAAPSAAQAAANRCAGPIEIAWAAPLPHEIAQHNYCGGAWFNSVQTGTKLRVVGGTQPGVYVANGRRLTVGKGTSSSQLQGLGDLVLQTCVGSQMVLVGLDRA